MSMLLPVSVNGVSYQAQAEYTQGPVLVEYQDAIKIFTDTFNVPAANAEATLNGPYGSSTYNQAMQDAIQKLLDLAQNGRPDPTSANPTKVRYMTVDMASTLDQLLRSLKAVGIPVDGSPITAQQVIDWRNFAYSSQIVVTILKKAEAATTTNNRTLQALTELVYVQTGNQILADQLETLENALSSTKDVLNTLNDLQQLHNQITVADQLKFGAYVGGQLGFGPNGTVPLQYMTGVYTFKGGVANPGPNNINLGFTHSNGNYYDWDGKIYEKTNLTPIIVPGSGRLDTRLPEVRGFYTNLYIHSLASADALRKANPGYNFLGAYGAGGTFYAGVQGQIIVTTRPDATQVYRVSVGKAGGDPSLFALQIPKLASAHFGNPITPGISSALLANMNPAIQQFLALREKLRLEISALSQITPKVNGQEDSQSLLGRIRVVYNDMQKALSGAGLDLAKAVRTWILDSYSAEGLSAAGAATQNPGAIQNALTNAIGAGQNLNDTQKEDVRRYLFVFEEYYKSASAILTKLTQIIEKMAQGIQR